MFTKRKRHQESFVICSCLTLLVFKLANFDVVSPLEYCKNGIFTSDCVPRNCTNDRQCKASSPGPYSRCRIEFARCECFHNNRHGIAINGTCLPVKTGGDLCTSQRDCMSIKGQSACLGMTMTYGVVRGICGCQDPKAYYHEELNECFKLQNTEGASCKLDIQCSHLLALGLLSKCDEHKRICRCWDTRGGGAEPMGWHNGRCYYSRAENEACDLREECVIGFHKNADCLPNESFGNGSVCTCPKSESCEVKVDPEDAAQVAANSNSSFIQNKTISIIQFILLCLNTFYFLPNTPYGIWF